jgi:RNA polymerase sigma-70 factor, ECF subfamily
MSLLLVDNPRDRAFERLYERYVREVYRYALAVLRNPSEAEDVTQTTFLNAYRAIQAGEDPQKPHNWLIAIAHNACRSRVRFVMRRPKEVPLDDIVEQLAVPESERLNVRELLRALGRLPFNQRAALTLRELEGRSYPEIAETLGVSVPAVESLIARARKTLRLQAAALRGLTVFQLPRSLRRLLESGDASGSAIGAGAVAKAAAFLVAGAVAGGVGYTATGDGQTPHSSVAPRLELRHHAASPPARSVHLAKAAKLGAPVRAAVLPPLSPASIGSGGSAAPVSATTAPAADPSPRALAPTLVETTAASVPVSLPEAVPPPLQLPQLLPDTPATPSLPLP